MIAEIIGVGRLSGALDSQAQVFAREVSLLGVDLHFQTDAGEDRMRLAQAMAQALRRSDIIITAGGLGMEPSDCTKEVICQGLSIPMDLHAESYQRIRAWFEAAGLPVPAGAQRASMVPRGGIVFPGEDGCAPGVAVTAGDQCILMLPGAPEQLVPMFMNYVVPFLAKFSGATIVSRVARLFGVDERETLQKLYDLQNSRNPAMTLYTHKGEVLVRVTARANNRQQAANMCTPFLKEIVGRLGDFVYGIDVDSLESVVVTHLTQKGLQLATAESCTGGLLTQKLNLVPGAANVFKFGVSARADRVKIQVLKVPEKIIRKFGAVSERAAVHMACGAMDAGDADIGLAVTGVADGGESDVPNGLVFIAACNKNQVVVKRLSLPPDTPVALIRETAVSHALNLVRLMLDYDPEAAPGAIPLGPALKGKIELCDDIPPATVASELADIDKPRGRRGGGVDPRTIIMAVLLVILIGALGFIGYALYDRFFPDGFSLPFGSSSSESEPESEEEESPSSEDGEESEEEPSEDEDEEPSMIGPAIGRKHSSSEEEEEPSIEEEEEDPSSEEDIQPAAAPPPSSSAPAVAPSSSSQAVVKNMDLPASSSSKEEPSSSEGSTFVLEPGMVYNVRTGAYTKRTDASSEDEELDMVELDLDPDDYEDEADDDYEDDEDDGRGSGGSYSVNEKITVRANGSKTVTAPFQEIVERVVQIEMGASFEREALRAQAVAAYTYIEYALARGQTPNVMLADKSAVASKVSSAVADVIGEEIVYSGKVINATYFASSAGVTNNSDDVWTEALPYLRSVDSDERVSEKTVTYSESKMRRAIEDALGFDPDDYADPDDWISDVSYCRNGEYVDEITFCGRKSKPGAWVRANMLTNLTSHAFDVEYDGDDFVFTVRGAGHGVGMSQMGANAMAKDGYRYDEILEHYYTNARVR